MILRQEKLTALVLGPWLLFLFASAALCATYHVSSSAGDDANSGLSPGEPWKTINRVNTSVFLPGDAILFKRGDTWREELVIDWSGTPDAPISFGGYGEGALPQILGSNRAESWTLAPGQSTVWRSGTSLIRPYVGHPASIFFGEQDGTLSWGRTLSYSTVPSCGTNFSNLQQEYDWCWENAVYVYSPENPTNRYTFIEVPQRRGSITMQSHQPQEHIVIDGLEMMFGTMYGYNDGWPMNYEVRGLTVQNCHIGHIGIRGGNSAMGLVIWHSDMLVRNNDIHDCGRRSISYNVYTDNSSQPNGLVFENVVFEHNTLHNGYHTTGFDVSHGDNRQSTLRNFTFRHNLIYDVTTDDPNNDPTDYTSMGLYLWAGAASFEDFKIYNNVLKNIKQKGFAIGGGSHSNLEIFNNVLYGMNPNISDYRAQAHISGTHSNLKFYNNIMFGTVDLDRYPCRGMYYGGNRDGVAMMDHNLYFQLDPRQQILEALSQSYHMDDWDEYQADTGWDLNGPLPQDPRFVNPETDDFRLLPGSVAHDAGAANGMVFTGASADIGLLETVLPGVMQ